MSSARPKSARKLNPIEAADLAVAEALAIDGRTVAARRVNAFAELGDQPPLRMLCAATIAAGLASSDRKLVRTGLRLLAAHSVATAIKGFFKDRIDRTRPGDAMEKGRYRMTKGESSQPRLSSMPSGHSAGLVAVARAAGREYPAAGPPAGAAAVAVMAAL